MSGLFSDHRQAGDLDPGAIPATPAQQVVAVYQTNRRAHVARDALIAAGIPGGGVHLIERADPAMRNSVDSRRQSFWAALGSLFTRAEDPTMYHLASDPDHALVILRPGGGMDVRRALQVLRSSHPIYVFPTVDADGAPVRS